MTGRLRRTTALLLVCFLGCTTNAFAQESKDNKTDDRTRDGEIRSLIRALYAFPWEGPQLISIPATWLFNFTPPMNILLEIGPSAQPALLEKLSDPQIKDQVIILLGGVGDERAVGPIIDAMINADQIDTTRNAKRINLCANLALTNITVADVIWHHGGGTIMERCVGGPKFCWATWWDENRRTFTVRGVTQIRTYSNYPNYGIYKQP